MKLMSAIIGALSFGDTTSPLGLWVRRVYFGIGYNTTFPVNVMLALGAATPYIVYLALRGQATVGAVLSVTALTVLSGYFYNLIYLVNDLIDWRKDARLAIPKQTARHVLGPWFALILAAAYTGVVALVGWIWPSVTLPLVGYGLALVALSVVHSRVGRGKVLTVFVERLAKFASPLAIVYAATGRPEALHLLWGALMVYPLGFTFDYAYRGYLRDRLGLGSGARFGLYGLYWALLAVVAARWGLGSLDLMPALWYALMYGLTVAATHALARVLPLGFLNDRYDDHVAGEKRRLLTYGAIQVGLVGLGLLYAIFA